MESKTYKFIDFPSGNEVSISREEILSDYFETWKRLMYERFGDSANISEDACIFDWCIINWAWEA